MKRITWGIVAICIIAMFIVGKTMMHSATPKSPSLIPTKSSEPQSGSRQNGDARNRGNSRLLVSVYTAKLSNMEEKIISSGTTIASKDIELRSEATGRITEIHFREGTQVHKGQILLKVNDSDLQAQLAKVQATFLQTQEREKRQKILFDKAVISIDEYQGSLRDLESSKADLQLIRAQLDKTTLVAPFDGIIGLCDAEVGGYITVGTRIANLVSTQPLKIEFSASERYFGRIKTGMEFSFTTEVSPAIYLATVTAIEPKIDLTTRTIHIRGECKNPDNRVAPGTFAKVTMVLHKNANALLVPSEALVPDVQGYKLFIVKDSTAQPVVVTTGTRDERNVEITKGLKEGDLVVVSGLLSIRPGMKVSIAESDRSTNR